MGKNIKVSTTQSCGCKKYISKNIIATGVALIVCSSPNILDPSRQAFSGEGWRLGPGAVHNYVYIFYCSHAYCKIVLYKALKHSLCWSAQSDYW